MLFVFYLLLITVEETINSKMDSKFAWRNLNKIDGLWISGEI